MPVFLQINKATSPGQENFRTLVIFILSSSWFCTTSSVGEAYLFPLNIRKKGTEHLLLN